MRKTGGGQPCVVYQTKDMTAEQKRKKKKKQENLDGDRRGKIPSNDPSRASFYRYGGMSEILSFESEQLVP